MATQGRSYLKSRFETGDTPTQQDFADLVDSAHNLVDDTYPSWMSYASAWQAQGYPQGTLVVHQGIPYISILSTSALDVPSASARWERISTGMVHRGTWSGGIQYLVQDVVHHSGSTYVCTIEPDSGQDPTDTGYWTQLGATPPPPATVNTMVLNFATQAAPYVEFNSVTPSEIGRFVCPGVPSSFSGPLWSSISGFSANIEFQLTDGTPVGTFGTDSDSPDTGAGGGAGAGWPSTPSMIVVKGWVENVNLGRVASIYFQF